MRKIICFSIIFATTVYITSGYPAPKILPRISRASSGKASEKVKRYEDVHIITSVAITTDATTTTTSTTSTPSPSELRRTNHLPHGIRNGRHSEEENFDFEELKSNETKSHAPSFSDGLSSTMEKNAYGIGRKQSRGNDGSFIVRGYDRNPKHIKFGFAPLEREHQNEKYGDPEAAEEEKLEESQPKIHHKQVFNDTLQSGRSFALTHQMFQDFSPGFVHTAMKGGQVDHSGHPHALTVWPTLSGSPTFYIGHRGEKVFMPEHTLPAYEFAIIMGADVLETDLVLTKDGVLVCYHDLVLGHGTDVDEHEEFEFFKTNYNGVINMKNVTLEGEWFIKDFTLEQLKKLTVIQRKVGVRPLQFNRMFKIPTFAEFLELVHREAFRLKRPIAITPELKDPFFHNSHLGNGDPHFMENVMLKELQKAGYPLKENDVPHCKFHNGKIEVPCGNVIVQSFHDSTLKYFKEHTDIERALIVDIDLIDLQFNRMTHQGIHEISKYANYYAIWKELLYTGIEAEIEANEYPVNRQEIADLGGFVEPAKIVETCHHHNMKVMLYTIYDSREPSHRGCAVNCEPRDKEGELFYFFDMGVDVMFIENVPEGLELRERYNSMLASTKHHTSSDVVET